MTLRQSLIHPDNLPVYRDCIDSQVNGTAPVIDLEYRVRSRPGEWRWVYVRSKSVDLDATGRPTRIIGTVQDVTEARIDTEHLTCAGGQGRGRRGLAGQERLPRLDVP